MCTTELEYKALNNTDNFAEAVGVKPFPQQEY